MKVKMSLSFKFYCDGVTDIPENEFSKIDSKRIEEYKKDIENSLIREIANDCDKAYISDFNVKVEPVEKSDDSEGNN